MSYFAFRSFIHISNVNRFTFLTKCTYITHQYTTIVMMSAVDTGE